MQPCVFQLKSDHRVGCFKLDISIYRIHLVQGLPVKMRIYIKQITHFNWYTLCKNISLCDFNLETECEYLEKVFFGSWRLLDDCI